MQPVLLTKLTDLENNPGDPEAARAHLEGLEQGLKSAANSEAVMATIESIGAPDVEDLPVAGKTDTDSNDAGTAA